MSGSWSAGMRARWAALGTRARVLAIGLPIGALAIVGVLAIGALTARPPVVAVASPSPAPATPPASSPAASPSAPPSAAPTIGLPDPLLGYDGRLTLLLLGSDYRPAHPGNRTDSIMVVSVSPADGSVAAVSIPRDIARFPLPDGTLHVDKINSLYQRVLARVGREAAGPEMARIVGLALGVEIDSYALVGMYGLVEMIDAIGGVDVVLDRAVNDPYYWVNGHTRGVRFPAGVNHLNGARALIFARTRKGDSDFQRVRRQQQLVLATAEKVLDRGLSALPALLELGRTWVRTDLPLDQATSIFELIARADLEGARRDVFGPRYATKIPGTVNYELNLEKVRDLIADWFAPVPGSPITLVPPTPSPSPMPSGAGS